jgi:hypothetical protein
MRHAVAFVFITMTLALPLGAAPAKGSEPDATVILNFKGAYSAPAIAEMKKEAAHIVKDSGLHLGWTTTAEAFGKSFRELVVITFNGTCMFQPTPPRYDELGPYATTLVADGVVQPFGIVDCDHVASSAIGAMTNSDLSRADLLVGRALGRVVAHELFHMLTHSEHHGTEGVEKASLTAKQLITSWFPLSRADANRLRFELRLR